MSDEATTTPQMVTWILVADSQQARLYTRKNIERHIPLAGNPKHRHYHATYERELVSVAEPMHAEPREKYESGRDRLGRVFESASSAHHMSEPHITIEDEIRQHFAKSIATYLNKARAENAYNRLVLVAPPKFLGDLRDNLNKTVTLSVIAELPKDFTHLEGETLSSHLAGHLESIA
jgi:protein required for attachment to host cells